jgi:hypothetical protein
MQGVVSANIGTPVYLTATGYVCITSGPACLIGVLVQSSATGGFQVFSSNTATASTAVSGVVYRAIATGGTANAGIFFDFPADFPTGFCIRNIPSLDPKLTLFWSPNGYQS